MQEKPGRPCLWLRSAHTCKRRSVWGSSTPSTIPTTSTGHAGGSSWRRAPKPHVQTPPPLSPRSAALVSWYPTALPICSRTSSHPTQTCLRTQTPRPTSATQPLQFSLIHQQTLSHTCPRCTQTQTCHRTQQSLRRILAVSKTTCSIVCPALQLLMWSRRRLRFMGASCVLLAPPWSFIWNKWSWTCCTIWTAVSLNSTWVRPLTSLKWFSPAPTISKTATKRSDHCLRTAETGDFIECVIETAPSVCI